MKRNYIYIVLIVLLLATNVATLFHSYQHKKAIDHLNDHVEKYPLLDSTLPLLDKKDLIVNIQELREYLKALPEQNKDWAEMSIYFEVMSTGASITVNPDLKIWPASLTKLPMAMIAMKKVEKGEWTLDKTRFLFERKDADLARTPEIEKEIGKEYNLQFLLERLLLESDNTAFNMIVKMLSDEDILSIAEEVGLDELFSEGAKISAKDYTRLLRALYLSTYLNEDNSQKILTLLKDSEFKDFIKAGLPENVAFAHKWGTHVENNIFADSGIVYIENRPYIIAVMIHGKGSDHVADMQKADNLMREIGKKSYEYVKNYER